MSADSRTAARAGGPIGMEWSLGLVNFGRLRSAWCWEWFCEEELREAWWSNWDSACSRVRVVGLLMAWLMMWRSWMEMLWGWELILEFLEYLAFVVVEIGFGVDLDSYSCSLWTCLTYSYSYSSTSDSCQLACHSYRCIFVLDFVIGLVMLT